MKTTLAFLSFAACCNAKNYEAAPDTIDDVLDTVRADLSSGLTESISINLQDGTYQPLHITTDLSGSSPDAKVTIGGSVSDRSEANELSERC